MSWARAKAWRVAAGLVLLLLVAGCDTSGSRKALRACDLRMQAVQMASGVDASGALQFDVDLRIWNRGSQKAVLDSLVLDLATARGPLFTASHGGTQSIAPGDSLVARIHVRARPADLAVRAMEFMFSFPDSLRYTGEARVPVLGGLFHTRKTFSGKVATAAHREEILRALSGFGRTAPP